jgi:hypothetical protein
MHGRMMTGGRGVRGLAPRLPFCIVIAMIAARFALVLQLYLMLICKNRSPQISKNPGFLHVDILL